MKEQKISFLNMLLIYLAVIYNPAIIIVPKYTAKVAKEGAWLSEILPCFILCGVFCILNDIYKKHKKKSFSEIICLVLGEKTGKILLAIYGIISFLFLCLSVRYFAEDITSTIMKGTNMQFLLFFILGLVALTARKGFVPVARINVYIMCFHLSAFLLMLILSLFKINFNFLFPVTEKSIFPIIKSGAASVYAKILIIPIFFLSNYIKDKENIKKHGIRFNLFVSIIMVILIVSIIGTFGHSFTAKLPLPFLALAKYISVFGIVEKIEALIINDLFIAHYYVTIIVFVLIICEILKEIFKIKQAKYFINPLLVLVYFISILLVSNHLELVLLSEKILLPISILIYLGLTLIIYAIGKIRKVI